jgi:hypothetical protein
MEVKLSSWEIMTDRPTDRRTDRAIGKFHLNICGNVYVNSNSDIAEQNANCRAEVLVKL